MGPQFFSPSTLNDSYVGYVPKSTRVSFNFHQDHIVPSPNLPTDLRNEARKKWKQDAQDTVKA